MPRTTAKQKHRNKLLGYLGNPDNDFPTRDGMSVICRISRNTLYHHFTPDELTEIEAEGLEIRRKKYATALSKVDTAVLREAAKGDMQAAKLAYQRFEEWTEKKKTEFDGRIGVDISEIPIRFVEAEPKEEDAGAGD